MRGDPPKIKEKKAAISGSTPHARGSTLRCLHYTGRREVYPACAGIHPSPVIPKQPSDCLPRMRGDPPSDRLREDITALSTPHARGSTPLTRAG